ncbi:accessory Sec system glycosyltransferase GtfA [Macrococcus animalis]|uniref:accessory Sec system glycosyltransferase GtfA n=1 Tax=Macrococcus animalis TaxID=3395467 RepID=UPI0039BE9BF1
MIYNINFGIGWASSGVEYAQRYRAKIFRDINVDAKFVFLDFISNENIQTLTSNMDFQDDEVIWLYQYFTDIKISPTTYTVDNIKESIHGNIIREEQVGKILKIIFEGQNNFIACYLKDADSRVVDRAEFVSNGFLIRKDFYTYVKLFSEYYAPFDNKAKVYMRTFFNEDGSVAYKEYIDNDNSIFDFPNEKLYSKSEFVGYFIKALNLTKKDIVILDRATVIGQAVLQNKGESKVGVVIHAEHYSANFTDDQYILWNNYYDYQFTQNKHIDFYITATETQNNLLKQQFHDYKSVKSQIYTIPVGSIDELKGKDSERQPYSIITASRLASEKHIDWIVQAVVQAQKVLPDIRLDIYGEGVEKGKIFNIINTHNASSFINLKGHEDLDNVYSQYELFLSGSTSEGFGLTLMEAVGSGLGLIGFDVNYGNPTFINSGKNGLLVPYEAGSENHEALIQRYADAIIAYYKTINDSAHKESYIIAKNFLTDQVIEKWKGLIEEVQK